MVIHDLRNPTSQINFTIQFVIECLKNYKIMQFEKIDNLSKIFESNNKKHGKNSKTPHEEEELTNDFKEEEE